MPKAIDITGQRFGRLTAIAPTRIGTTLLWECSCECGGRSVVRAAVLRNGNTTSCGCHKRTVLPVSTTKHGMADTSIYRIWKSMRQRCNNPRNPAFHNYGGRGIKVCQRWEVFDVFYADMGDRPDGRSLDRIDTDGPYSPENCRWATPQEQSENMRCNHYITWRGCTKTITAWARLLGRPASWLQKRLKKYKSLDEAMQPLAASVTYRMEN